MQSEVSLNLEIYSLTCFQQGLIIKSHKGITGIETYLWINSISLKIHEVQSLDENIITQLGPTKQYVKFSAFLGIFEGNMNHYVVFCEKCYPVANVGQYIFYKIDQVNFLPIKDEDPKSQQQEISDMIKLLNNGFYFCPKGDITLSQQDFHQNKKTKTQFQWNNRLCKFIDDYNLNLQWVLPICQGFIQSFQLSDISLNFMIISRRNRFQAGTRFNCRGIDDEGNVANFVETEQILYYQDILYSFVSIRGSVPVFWNQDGVGKQIELTRSLQQTFKIFEKHFSCIIQQYGNIHCINLLGKGADVLNDAYFELHQNLKSGQVRYEIFDFKKNKNAIADNYDLINDQIRKTVDSQQKMGSFVYVLNHNKIIAIQNGVYRINCIDCLDRTNLYQHRLCFFHIFQALCKFGSIDNISYNLQEEIQIFDSSKQLNRFVTSFKNIWANNGDILSWIYAGSNSTTSQLTRDGKKTVWGSINHQCSAVQRFFNSKRSDKKKHLAIQQLLQGSNQKNQSEFDYQLQSQRNKYCTFQKIKVYALTWNVKYMHPQNFYDVDFYRLFFQNDSFIDYDLMIIGLQTMNIASQQISMEWDNQFLLKLNEFGKFQTGFINICLNIENRDLVNYNCKNYLFGKNQQNNS